MISKRSMWLFLIILLVLPLLIVIIIREVFPANYLISSLYKLVFLIPIFYGIFISKKTLKKTLFEDFNIKIIRKKILLMSFIGIILVTIYTFSFLIFKNFIDINQIASNLEDIVSINASNIIFIGFYIIIINSILEEYFWRGFIFKQMINIGNPILVYLITGVAFSLHHIIFFYSWFSLPFIILTSLGLIFFAMIMNLIFSRYKDLFSCWLIHGLVDIVQIGIALYIFNII